MRKSLLMLVFVAGSAMAQDLDRAAEQLAAARAAPLVTQAVPGDWSLAKAYRVQRKFYELRHGATPPLGYKAGLTTGPSQLQFAVMAPVAGLLPPQSAIPSQGGFWRIDPNDFQAGRMELELGFRFAEPIRKPIDDPLRLKALVAEVLPVVELPDLNFQHGAAPGGMDLVAANVAAHKVILGSSRLPSTLAINSLPVRLRRGDADTNAGTTLIEARATDALGDQWLALQWLVNQVLSQGWQIEPGQVLITGALGPVLPLEPGEYVADFGALGSLRFEVRSSR
ncbi:MAG: hypothetical protein RBS22_10595 [Spongiibacteraceae bacterium]|jgi:2-keto-4-pentenoate hydratase|nr:hypothetical protein [Spongiibacteraceae bacterium]